MPSPATTPMNACESSAPPIILFKTPSTPSDAYKTYFSTPTPSPSKPTFNPIFLPLLQHTLLPPALSQLHTLLTSPTFTKKYGGIILTSQRAVEALGSVLTSLQPPPSANCHSNPDSLENINRVRELELPLYTVGPATSRALGVLQEKYLPRCRIEGQETGKGANLAQYILKHYSCPPMPTKDATPTTDAPPKDAADGEDHTVSNGQTQRLPLLFLVGETRRDIIPVSLMSEGLPPEERIRVHELVVYETQLMEDFRERLSRTLCHCGGESEDGEKVVEGSTDNEREGEVAQRKVRKGPVWVVVFSPAGCRELVKVLRAGQGKEENKGGKGEKRVFVATIGPTTRDVMVEEHGWEVDVCAEKPSPEGLGEGIERFMQERG
ncbi:hypothetical protein MMC30_007511 [Trapelia coarctata]|nr:hypothetical protein [Trapelia coarctata]